MYQTFIILQKANFSKLHIQKCEINSFSRESSSHGHVSHSVNKAKCLGYWGGGAAVATVAPFKKNLQKSIEEKGITLINTCKACLSVCLSVCLNLVQL